VIAVGFVPGFLDGKWSGAPAAVRHDRVRARESAARGTFGASDTWWREGSQVVGGDVTSARARGACRDLLSV
jgi:hypothetical protein